jgi:predicted phosphodiesterase
MDILFYGDPHGDFFPLFDEVRRARPDLIVILGDVGPCLPLDQVISPLDRDGIVVRWIHGNHDADSVELFDHSLAVLPDANLHGRVEAFGALRIAGLGGVYRAQVWAPAGPDQEGTAARYDSPEAMIRATRKGDLWRGGLPRRHRASIFPSDHKALISAGPADILVCHEAPSCHRHGFTAIDELAAALGVRLVVHGHHHVDYESQTKSGIQVRGVGLAGCFRVSYGCADGVPNKLEKSMQR